MFFRGNEILEQKTNEMCHYLRPKIDVSTVSSQFRTRTTYPSHRNVNIVVVGIWEFLRRINSMSALLLSISRDEISRDKSKNDLKESKLERNTIIHPVFVEVVYHSRLFGACPVTTRYMTITTTIIRRVAWCRVEVHVVSGKSHVCVTVAHLPCICSNHR